MLTKQSLESARILAEELNRRRVVVEVLPDTPLERLVEAGHNPVEAEPETIDAAVESLALTTLVVEETTANSHDNVMEDLTDRIVGLIDRRLDMTRNVLNPLISQYANAIVNHVGDMVPPQPEINEVEFGEFHDNPIIRDIFSGYGYNELTPLDTMQAVPFNDENNYHRDALVTGSKYLDDKLKSIVDTRGDEWYRNLAKRYFVDGSQLNIINPELSEAYAETVDENLVTHMLARHLYNQEHPLTKDSTHAWDGKLLEILGRTSQNLGLFWKYKDDLDKRNIVTPNIVMESHSVTVYGPNYRKYLEQGGSRTAIMGHVRQKGPRLSVEQLIEQSDVLEKHYDNEVNAKLRQLRSDKFKLLREGALANLATVVTAIPRDITDTLPELAVGDAQQLLLQRGREYINNYRGLNIDDVDGYAENIILVGLLPELELSEFMRQMDKYLKPAVGATELTPKQAAYYVVLEELVKFFMSQTSLSGKR